jgi:hypothetical protein
MHKFAGDALIFSAGVIFMDTSEERAAMALLVNGVAVKD